MAVEISDFGMGFDFTPDQIIGPEQVVDDKNERGLGLYIVSQFVDDIHYQRGSDSSNTTRLTKQL